MKKALVTILGATAAACAGHAGAQSPFYVGGGLGQSNFKEGCSLLFNSRPVTCEDSDTAWRIFGGYQFSPALSAEVAYSNLGAVQTTRTGGAQEIAASVLEASLVGALRIQSLALLGRLGGYRGAMDASGVAQGSNISYNFTYGLGFEYAITPNVAVRGEWQRYVKMEAIKESGNIGGVRAGTTGATDVNVLGVSVLWRSKALEIGSGDGVSVSNLYVGGNVGQSLYGIECAGLSCDDRDTAFRLFGGYRITPDFSVELGYANLGKASISGRGGTDELAASAGDLTAVFQVPFPGSGFSIFGRGGLYLGRMQLSGVDRGEKTSANLTLGFGAGYEVTRKVGVRAEWQRYWKMKARNDLTGAQDEGDVGFLSIGAIYRFQ